MGRFQLCPYTPPGWRHCWGPTLPSRAASSPANGDGTRPGQPAGSSCSELRPATQHVPFSNSRLQERSAEFSLTRANFREAEGKDSWGGFFGLLFPPQQNVYSVLNSAINKVKNNNWEAPGLQSNKAQCFHLGPAELCLVCLCST